MSITQATYADASTAVTLSPMVLTDRTVNLFTNIIANIQSNENTLQTLASESETKFNEVITTVNALKAGTEVDLASLEATMAKIIELEEGEGNTSFVTVFQQMFEEINRREEVDTFRAEITNAVGGKFAVDLSAFEFETVEEYQIVPKIPTQENRLITATFEKVDEKGGIITLRNEEVFQSAEISTSFYDPAGNTLPVILLVVKAAKPINGKVTLTDGSEATFGREATVYPEDVIVSSGSLVFNTDHMEVLVHMDNSIEAKSYIEAVELIGANGQTLLIPEDKARAVANLDGDALSVLPEGKLVIKANMKVVNVTDKDVEQKEPEMVEYTFEEHKQLTVAYARPNPFKEEFNVTFNNGDYLMRTGARLKLYDVDANFIKDLGKVGQTNGVTTQTLSMNLTTAFVTQKWEAQATESPRVQVEIPYYDDTLDVTGVQVSQDSSDDPVFIEVVNGEENATYTVFAQYFYGLDNEVIQEIMYSYTADGAGNFDTSYDFPAIQIPDGSGGYEDVKAHIAVTKYIDNGFTFSDYDLTTFTLKHD